MSRQLSSSFGFACMFGGVLFPGLLLVLGSLLAGGAPETGTAVADQVILVTFVFFLVGVVGLYLAQRDALGRIGTAAAGILAVGLVSTIANGLMSALGITIPFADPFELVAFVLLIVGTIAFGLAIAWADVLLHGRFGGVLLTAALPLSLVGILALGALGVDSPTIEALVIGVPFGSAWVILGLDLLTLADYEAPVEVAEAQ